MRIGERIKQRRLELGYTAEAIAKLLKKIELLYIDMKMVTLKICLLMFLNLWPKH